MKINKTGIIGMGALGLMYGDYILDNVGYDSCEFILDDNRYERYQSKRFTVLGKEKKFPMVKASECERGKYDLIIVAVKYNSLDSAIETIADIVDENTIIMSVLNGITSEEILSERFGRKNLIYTVAQGMDAMHFGDSLVYTKMGELHIGLASDGNKEVLDAVKNLLDEAKLANVVENDIMRRMWGKFMLNVGVNQTCHVYETTYGVVTKPGKPYDTLVGAMREVVKIAELEGISLGEDDIEFYVNLLRTLDPDGVPSMRQDGIAHRASEVDMFAGTVIDIAKKHGVEVPVNEWIYKTVKEMEGRY